MESATHDVVIVSIPLVAILAGILFNRMDVRELRAEMQKGFERLEKRMDERFQEIDERFEKVDSRLDSINADLRQFYHLTGKMEERID